MGLGSPRVSIPERRDRLWLLNAFAVALLTLLGAAGSATLSTVSQTRSGRES
jgi:hypothetical protein